MSDSPSPMNKFPEIPADSHARQDYILGRPPRIPPLPEEQRTERQQELVKRFGTLVIDGETYERDDKESIEILVKSPELYAAHMAVADIIFRQGAMSLRHRELAVLRLAWLSQAPFEWGQHVFLAKKCGISSEEIQRIIEGSQSEYWSREESAILRAIEELHFDSMICDETWEDLASFLDDKQLIELPILAGQYKTVAYYQNVLRHKVPKGNEGLFAR